MDHMLLNCEYSQEIWRFGLGKLGWKGPLLDTFKKWLEAYCFNPRRSVFSDIWNILLSTTLWLIWKEHNNRIFENKETEAFRLCGKLEKAILELVSNVAYHTQGKIQYGIQDMQI